jgi:hypothetical protein
MNQYERKTLPTGITVQWVKTDRNTMIADVSSKKYEQLKQKLYELPVLFRK